MFDAAAMVITTPFFFASEISDVARPLAIAGSRELIARGDHREAVFWIVATASRCQRVLLADAPPDVRARFADLQRRHDQAKQSLPLVWEVAQEIIAANPEIE